MTSDTAPDRTPAPAHADADTAPRGPRLSGRRRRGHGLARLRRAAGLLAVTALLLVPQVAARPSPPEDLEGSYSFNTGLVTLTWQPPPEGNASFNYHVWRDGGTYLGGTAQLTFSDTLGQLPDDPGFLYFVSAAPPGNPNNIGIAAVAGVSTSACEVASVTMSWEPPFLYAHLHMECIGGMDYDKQAVWEMPN